MYGKLGLNNISSPPLVNNQLIPRCHAYVVCDWT